MNIKINKFKNISTKNKIILLVVISFFILFIAVDSFVSIRYFIKIKKTSLEFLDSSIESYNNHKDSDIKILSATLEALLINEEIRNIYLEGDREKLYNYTLPFYEKLKEKYGVTHWYFINPEPDSTCFLRVSNFEKFGDKITRFTYASAVKNKDFGIGIELGKTVFALRVVHPYYDQNGDLIGYVGLGKELDRFFDIIKEETGSDFSLLVLKKYLDKENWGLARESKGLRDNWDDMENIVCIKETSDIPVSIDVDFENIPDEGVFLGIFKDENLRYSKSIFPLYDAGNRKAGGIFVISDITSSYIELFQDLLIISLILAAIFAPIGIILLILCDRISKELITAKASAEKATQHARAASQAKSLFLANMSHEIRTPMNVILGFSELLKNQIKQPKQRGYISSILSSVKILLVLINDILDLSKIEAGKIELRYRAVNLQNLFNEIEGIFSIKAKDKGLRFLTVVDKKLPEALYLDEVRIRQILFNLVGNSVKFTQKGYVRLEVKGIYCKDKSRVSLTFSVEDTGIGILAEDKKIIFDTFSQSKKQHVKEYGGTGLGLSITKRLTEVMGGSISVESTVGKGSTFVVALKDIEAVPIDDISEDMEEKTDIDKLRFKKQTILVVDDVKSGRMLLRETLEPYNLTIIEAKNERESIDVAREHTPDLILMDLRMSVMDGHEAIKILKGDSNLKHIPIIVLTAFAMKEQLEETKKTNCNGCIKKPIKKSQLIRELAKYLTFTESGAGPKEEETKTKEKEITGVVKNSTREEAATCITSEEKKKLPGLIAMLESRIKSNLKKVTKTFIISDIKDFASEVEELGKKYNLKIVLDWANKITVQADSFDMEKLPATLNYFPRLVEKVKKLSKQP